jgi:hypothetical protein
MRQVTRLAIAALLLTACTFGAGTDQTPTLSGELVLQTAEAAARQTREAFSPTPTRVLQTPTPTAPVETGTPTATSTPTFVTATADVTANVRSGPGSMYDWVDFLYQGDTAEVVGRFESQESDAGGTWWLIHRIGQGRDGWVWGGVVTVSGDVSGVPYMIPPPSSTPGPTLTSTPEPTTETPSP